VNMSTSPVGLSKFLFAMFQGSGNIPPILTVARQLVTHGHHVRIIAGPGIDHPSRPVSTSFLEGIKTAGASLVPFEQPPDAVPRTPIPGGLLRGWTPPMYAVNARVAQRFQAAPIWAQNVTEVLHRQSADVVVADFLLLGALAAAEAAKIPAVALWHTVYHRPIPDIPPYGPGFLPRRGPIGWLRDTLGHAIIRRVHARESLPVLNQTRARLGLHPLQSSFEQYDAAARVLIMTSPAFDYRSRLLQLNVRHVGMPFEDAGSATWESPWTADDSRPLLLVSFSTAPQGQAEPLRHTIKALETLRVRGLVTLGPALSAGAFKAPENVVLTAFAPHALVLPQAAAIVSQCGHGTVMKALSHGIPVVCLPLVGDQSDVAGSGSPCGCWHTHTRRCLA
jgi:UDP:flavonoid glycosyltransferase YjiC (YdhE family)